MPAANLFVIQITPLGMLLCVQACGGDYTQAVRITLERGVGFTKADVMQHARCTAFCNGPHLYSGDMFLCPPLLTAACLALQACMPRVPFAFQVAHLEHTTCSSKSVLESWDTGTKLVKTPCMTTCSWHMDYMDLLVRKRMALAAWRAKRDAQRAKARTQAALYEPPSAAAAASEHACVARASADATREAAVKKELVRFVG